MAAWALPCQCLKELLEVCKRAVKAGRVGPGVWASWSGLVSPGAGAIQTGREEPTPTQLEGFTQPPGVQAVSQGHGVLAAILSPLQSPALLQGAPTIYKLLQD